MSMQGAPGSQERAPDFLELDLQGGIVSHCVGMLGTEYCSCERASALVAGTSLQLLFLILRQSLIQSRLTSNLLGC